MEMVLKKLFNRKAKNQIWRALLLLLTFQYVKQYNNML